MNAEGFIAYVEKWLLQNKEKFLCEPFTKRVEDDAFCIKFKSLPFIEVRVDDYGLLDVWATVIEDNQEYYDNLFDASSLMKYCSKGYYCEYCIQKKYYKTKEQVWDKHLSDLLSWANANITNETMPKITVCNKNNTYYIKFFLKISK